MVITNPQKVEEVLTRRVDKILPSKKALKKLLLSGKKIRLYQGFDPTGYRLHLGHIIGLKKLMEFANLGHEVIFLFGTGTVLAGDPSQRERGRGRTLLETSEKDLQKVINKNIKDWKKQTSQIVDFKNPNVKIKKNGDWLCKLSLKDVLNIASHISSVQLFKRDMFQKRIKRGDTVWTHEVLYPLLQGYDSVYMDVDLEIGGTDQEFNMLIGRELLHKMKGKEKFILTVPMILGTDGKQMSKTSGNCVWLDDSAKDMFGKLMGIPDEQIVPYMELVSDIPTKEVKKIKKGLGSKKIHPMKAKKKLGLAVTKQFHGEKKAQEAQRHFERVFQKRKLPKKSPSLSIKKLSQNPINIIDLLVETKLATSRSQAKRLVKQKAVKINNEAIEQLSNVTIKSGNIIHIGKKKWLKTK